MGLFLKILRSRRVLGAMASNAGLSLGSLVLAVAVARESTTEVFGAFSLGIMTYVFISGLLRVSIIETSIVAGRDILTAHRAFSRLSFLSLIISVFIVAVGLLIGNFFVIIMGILFNGMCLFDSVRVYNLTVQNERLATIMGSTSALMMFLAAGSTLLISISAEILFGFWALTTAVMGYGVAILTKFPVRPKWIKNRRETRQAIFFSLDYLVGSGGATLSTVLLGYLLNPTIVGGIRGAGTLLGPVNMASSTARSLTIAFLARRRLAGPRVEAKSALDAALVLGMLTSALAAVLALTPATVGTFLLGPTWAIAAPALLPLAIESVLALLCSIPSAGLRAASAGSSSLKLRIITGLPRPFIVLWAASELGIAGAAWSMAAISAVNLILWWGSYLHILFRDERLRYVNSQPSE